MTDDTAIDASEGLRKVYYDYKDIFEYWFDAPLSQFFDVNRGGFQAMPFCTQILEYEGPHPGLALYKWKGKRCQNMIADILNDCAEVMRENDAHSSG